MIKAIETQYAGCLFRSRLEARWAVFFDALGIHWEYEVEGYDLGEAGWYLPDFWLPDFGAWVEVKSNAISINTKPLKVFCAGKVGGRNHNTDWRYTLLEADEDFFFDTQREYTGNPPATQLDMTMGCKYVGPFSYDGCGGHGSGNAMIFDNHGSWHPEYVIEDCQQRIRSCDVVFAWIDSEDCFGTLVELGYAAALGKAIWIGCPLESPLDTDNKYTLGGNLWYAFAAADKIQVADTPECAFTALYTRSLAPEQRKCLALAIGANKPVLMLHGNPWPGEYKLLMFSKQTGTHELQPFNPQWATTLKAKNTDVQRAFSAARSAQFEHGRSGAR